MGVLKVIKEFGKEHGSTVCVIGAIVGIGFTIYEAWTARPKVDKIMDEQNKKMKEIESSNKSDEEKKKARKDVTIETVKMVSMAVLPLGGAAAATAGLTIGSRVIDSKKISDMTATIAMSDLAYKKLESKMANVIGEDKLKEAKKEIHEEDARVAIERELEYDSELTVIEQAHGGSQVYYDPLFGYLFRSDDKTIISACMALNNRMGKKAFDEIYIGYDEFFEQMELSNVPRASHHFIFDPDNMLEPNLNNTIKIGEISCTILEWYREPRCLIK